MHYSKEEKAMWIEDWLKSGKSAWAYAKENGLLPQTFTKWTKAKAESKPCFVPVPAQVLKPLEYPQEILIEKGEVKIHIPLCVAGKELHAIFKALAEAV